MMNVQLSFACKKQWHELTITDLTDVRYCDECDKQVFVVKTEAELSEAVALKHCIAIPNQIGFIEQVGIV